MLHHFTGWSRCPLTRASVPSWQRVVDMVVLGLLGVLAVLMQLEKLDLFRTRIEHFRSEQTVSAESSGGWGLWIDLGVALALLAGVYLLVTRPALRSRVMDLIRGFMEGLRTVFLTRKKGLFILHTLLIWPSSLGMFQVGFYCLPRMVDVPFAGSGGLHRRRDRDHPGTGRDRGIPRLSSHSSLGCTCLLRMVVACSVLMRSPWVGFCGLRRW